jgi:hypothetical protein
VAAARPSHDAVGEHTDEIRGQGPLPIPNPERGPPQPAVLGVSQVVRDLPLLLVIGGGGPEQAAVGKAAADGRAQHGQVQRYRRGCPRRPQAGVAAAGDDDRTVRQHQALSHPTAGSPRQRPQHLERVAVEDDGVAVRPEDTEQVAVGQPQQPPRRGLEARPRQHLGRVLCLGLR